MRNLLFLLACTAVGLAADEPPRQVKATFRVLSLGEPIERAGFLKGRDAVRLDVPSDFFSAVQEYRGPPIITFFQTPSGPAKADARDPLRKELARTVAAAEKFEAKHAEAAQAAAQAVADAPEGPEGDAARRLAAETTELAEREAESARAARQKAAEIQRQIDAMNPPDEKDGKERRKTTTDPKAGQLAMTPLGSVPVADGESLLLLFIAEEKGVRILRILDAAQRHPFGSLRFLNLGSAPLRLRTTETTTPVPPLSPVTFTPKPDAHGYVGLEVREDGPEGRLLRTLRARPEPAARTTYLLLADQDGLRLKGVTERAAR